MKIFLTGCAGFIGFHTTQELLKQGHEVIGVDNLNPYYDVTLKHNRLAQFKNHQAFEFHQGDVQDQQFIEKLFAQHKDIQGIIHLAAQAGVRYSLVDPYAYIQSNTLGHLNLLEKGRHLKDLQHFVYASTSSVYGANTKLPFSVTDPVNTPMSLYAASKRACELISYTYASLYQIPQTGLRFFTVYGPWGRPDMAAFLFTKGILAGQPIQVFNNGNMRRNFTYVDDIVQGVLGCLMNPPKEFKTPEDYSRLYNIGNDRSEALMDFIGTLETLLGKKAIIDFQPIQAGDVPDTIADIEKTKTDFGFQPQTNIDVGLKNFVDWYQGYYGTQAAMGY